MYTRPLLEVQKRITFNFMFIFLFIVVVVVDVDEVRRNHLLSLAREASEECCLCWHYSCDQPTIHPNKRLAHNSNFDYKILFLFSAYSCCFLVILSDHAAPVNWLPSVQHHLRSRQILRVCINAKLSLIFHLFSWSEKPLFIYLIM